VSLGFSSDYIATHGIPGNSKIRGAHFNWGLGSCPKFQKTSRIKIRIDLGLLVELTLKIMFCPGGRENICHIFFYFIFL
jgi:hypothetical protein